MSSSNTKTLEATLQSPSDWESWSHQFKSKAVELRLWGHIDPNQNIPLLPMPQLPQLERYNRRTPAEEPAADPAADPAAEPAPVSAADLTDAGRAALQIDMQYYIQADKRFREEEAAIQKLKDWVRATVAAHFVEVACGAADTLAVWFRNLQKHAGMTDGRSQDEARAKYKVAVRPLENIKEWEQWLQRWEKAISLAEKKKVPETLKANAWVKDFVDAVQKAAPAWATTYRMINKDKIYSGQLTFRDLADDFRNEVGLLVPSGGGKRKVAKGAFGPSYAGRDDPDYSASGDAQTKGAEEEDKARSKKGGAGKRKHSDDEDEDEEACPACGLQHSLSVCYYVFPDKAPRWFRLKKELRKKVKAKLAKDQSLRDQVEKLKSKRPKRQKKEDPKDDGKEGNEED